jgi:hypothetical protein
MRTRDCHQSIARVCRDLETEVNGRPDIRLFEGDCHAPSKSPGAIFDNLERSRFAAIYDYDHAGDDTAILAVP